MQSMKMTTKMALLLLVVFTVMPCTGRDRPNMVVVLVDDHAFEAISAYGTYLMDNARTPAIDRLAQEGMRCKV